MMELYSDFLMLSFGQTSATVLSRLMEGEVSHDQVTRFLRQGVPFSQTIWQLAKPLQRQVNCDEGVVSVDDSLVHKPHSQENGTIEWYYDHTTNRQAKGINFITF